MIYADFTSNFSQKILGRKIQKELYSGKYLKHSIAINQYILMIRIVSLLKYIQTKIQFTVFLITGLKKKKKYCSDAMEVHFNKEFVMPKNYNEDFNSSNCWICWRFVIDEVLK